MPKFSLLVLLKVASCEILVGSGDLKSKSWKFLLKSFTVLVPRIASCENLGAPKAISLINAFWLIDASKSLARNPCFKLSASISLKLFLNPDQVSSLKSRLSAFSASLS